MTSLALSPRRDGTLNAPELPATISTHKPKPLRRRRLDAKHAKPILRKPHQTRYSRSAIPLLPELVLPRLGEEDEEEDEENLGSKYEDGVRPSSPVSVAVVSPVASPRAPAASDKNPSHIHFYEYVRVKQIPSHTAYPESVKKAMWASIEEIQTSAKRNSWEFAADGWDWRSAAEEEDMYWHRSSKQYVHPAHIERAQRRHARAALMAKRNTGNESESESETRSRNSRTKPSEDK